MEITKFIGQEEIFAQPNISRVELEWRDANPNQVNEALRLQNALDELADFEYDAYVKRQRLTEWWQQNLWDKLSFKVVSNG